MYKTKTHYSFLHALIIVSVIIIDQWSKAWIVAHVPAYGGPIWSFQGDFFQIIHVRNTGALFSLGNDWPKFFNVLLLRVLPIVVLSILTIILVSPRQLFVKLPKRLQWHFSPLQGIAFAFAVGGGLGNMMDRLFRPEGVVDFLDVKFYGLFGWERWPTFNVADMAVVLFMILFLINEIFMAKKRPK